MNLQRVERHFLLVIANDFISVNSDRQSAGSLESQARILEAVRLVKCGVITKRDLVAIFPQGYHRSSPTTPRTRNGSVVSLGDNLADYFRVQDGVEDVAVSIKPRSWVIRDNFILTQQVIHNDYPHVPYALHIVADRGSIDDVMVYLPLYCPDHCTVVFHPVLNHTPTLLERWMQSLIRLEHAISRF